MNPYLIVPIYLRLLFEMTIFRISIQDGSPDDILESLCKLRIHESEKRKTVLELYNLEIHQKKAKPEYHRSKTMVQRSIEQNLRSQNFEARKGRIESGALVKSQREQRRIQKRTRRMLAMESSRAVFKRRQIQFPARQ